MACREIVTLQFGHYANFVGTHLWNLQCEAYSFEPSRLGGNVAKPSNEISFDSTFREGKTLNNQVTYTPRAIFYDLKDSLRTLKQTGTLYDIDNASSFVNSWNSSPSIHQQELYEKNKYLRQLEDEDLEEPLGNQHALCSEEDKDGEQEKERKELDLETSVEVWSDFLKQHLHPKTIETIHPGAGSFDLFGLGVEAYKRQQDEMEERVRFFTEECDSLQGFQVLLDSSDAFSGLACSFYEDYILDEFHNKAHVLFSLSSSNSCTNKDAHLRSLCNLMLTYNHFNHATSIIPLSTQSSLQYKPPLPSHRSFHNFTYNPSLPYHTSAVLATAFNNITLPYRDLKEDTDMKSFYSSLIIDSRNILATQLSYPFEFDNSIYNSLDTLKNPSKPPLTTAPLITSLTPSLLDHTTAHVQHTTISGLSKQQVFGSNPRSERYKETDIIGDYINLRFNTSSLKNTTSLYKTPLITADPFPRFTNSPHRNNLNTTPIATSLQNTSEISSLLQEVLAPLERVKSHHLRRYLGDFLEKDDYEDKLESFRVNHDKYVE